MQLVHEAVMYSSEEEYLAALVPFARDGLDSKEPVIAVTGARNAHLLRDALAGDADHVRFVDSATWFVRPATTVAACSQLFRDHLEAGTAQIRVIGEIVFGTSPARRREWMCYESILNRAFRDLPAWIVCPYDVRGLDAGVVDSAPATHEHVTARAGRHRSDRYEDPARFVAATQPDATVPRRLADLELSLSTGIGSIRRAVLDLIRRSGVDTLHAEPFVLACNEIVTNAIVHGGGTGTVCVWSDGRDLACEVVDTGPGIEDPLAGFAPPAPEDQSGRGLWLARQLCDDVGIRRIPHGGVAVAVHASA